MTPSFTGSCIDCALSAVLHGPPSSSSSSSDSSPLPEARSAMAERGGCELLMAPVEPADCECVGDAKSGDMTESESDSVPDTCACVMGGLCDLLDQKEVLRRSLDTPHLLGPGSRMHRKFSLYLLWRRRCCCRGRHARSRQDKLASSRCLVSLSKCTRETRPVTDVTCHAP